MALARIDNWSSPNSVAIFAQQPGKPFVQFLLTNVPIPTPQRVRLDLAESEQFSRRWSLARNPVERVTAQSRIKEPDTFTCTGMLSANPIFAPLEGAGLGRIDKFMLLQLHTILGRPDVICFIVTPDRKLPNMGCVAIDEVNDDNTGNGTQVTLSFEELTIATPGLVESALDLDALQMGAATTSDMGSTAPADVPDPGGFG